MMTEKINTPPTNDVLPLPSWVQFIFYFVSLAIVGLGQPAWVGWLGIIASSCGYALFWRILLSHSRPKSRFWLATSWFFGIQLIQLSWLISHPFLYIYALYFFLAILIGMQFGCLGICISLKEMRNPFSFLALAGFWTLLEWGRLFVLSGFSWNPVGIALTDTIYGLQMASLAGVYGLSFWVILTNLLAVKMWASPYKIRYFAGWIILASFPYVYGALHFHHHEKAFSLQEESEKNPLNVVLVQTAFPIEETLPVWGDAKKMIFYVLEEWSKIFKISSKHIGEKVDLIVLPEFVVPYGTYTFAFPFNTVKTSLEKVFGSDIVAALPPLASPLATQYATPSGDVWFVSNAYCLQALANIFQSHIVVGLEDVDGNDADSKKYFSAAQYFQPAYSPLTNQHDKEIVIQRYEKRVLVPMGEYIPFTFCQKIAADYGILGSFTPGEEAKVFDHPKLPFGVSICYEETFGHLMRENRLEGAALLVNLTSDIWYPNSRLPKQHFDHARLRTVENGIPLIRACNTGITGGIDSLGRVIHVLGDDYRTGEWLSDSIKITVPQYTYSTVYSQMGDGLIVVISMVAVLLRLCLRQEN
jgi:apolipoprotein N-acyltransferase